MRFADYQVQAAKTAIYPKQIGLMYVALGLCGEAGEVAEKVKKLYRDCDGVLTPGYHEAISKEAGDLLWYLTMLCCELNLSLDDVAHENLDKLKSRAERGVLHGNGDVR